MEHGLLEDAGHDRADRASRVRGVPDLLGGAAVLVLARAPSLLQTDEEGVDVCDVTLNLSAARELGEHQLAEPVPVGVGGGVLASFGDLRRPHVGGVTEPGLRSQ